MEISIGMVGASGSGKTSLMTAMFEDMRRHLVANADTRGIVQIQHSDTATKNAVAEAQRRFATCVRLERFIAWERSAKCASFGFRVRFQKDGLGKSFDFRIMDYPGGLLSDAERFAKECLPHIRRSVVLFVPIDAVALLSWFDARVSDPELAAAILGKLELDRCISVIETWAREGMADNRCLYFVPVKTESFYRDNPNAAKPREGDIEAAVRELFASSLSTVCKERGIVVELRPVDTYGCVALDEVHWNAEQSVLEETFRVSNGKVLTPRGAVDLFSSVLSRRLASLAEVAKGAADASRDIIENRNLFARVWRNIFGDPEKENLKKNETAADLYADALAAISRFSSGKREKVL